MTPLGRRTYAALVLVTLIWAGNWPVMKAALARADPFVFNVHRTVLGIAVLAAVLLVRRGRILPESWLAVIVTSFFQVSINFLGTSFALIEGGAGRTSVLVFTMPFWTLLLAWPLLGDRPRGLQWLAIALAFAGLTLVIAPWQWEGSLVPKLYAVLSGFGWAAATVATKIFQRRRSLDPLTFIVWQLVIGIIPFFFIVAWRDAPPVTWTPAYTALIAYAGIMAVAFAWLLWFAILNRLTASAAGFSMLAIPVIALSSSIIFFDERITRGEWIGIVLIGGALAILGALGVTGARRLAEMARSRSG